MKNIKDFFDVVFENNNFLAINKKTNLSTQKNNFYDKSVEEILEIFGEPFSLLERCGIVHRLDMNTTGLLIIAKNTIYQKKLFKIFKQKEIKKYYLSLNIGKTKTQTGDIKLFLKKSFSSNQKIKMKIGSYFDKFVYLKFEKISSGENFTLLKIEALTGRTHQIRLALESINLPIYNDEKYNNLPDYTKLIFEKEGHYLHAYRLSFFDGRESFDLFAKIPSFFTKKIKEDYMTISDEEIIKVFE